MKIKHQNILNFVYFICLFGPVFYWTWAIFTANLGAEPIVKLNTQSGYVGLCLLLVNLVLGALIFFKPSWLVKLKFFLVRRRSLGIFSGIYVLLHFLSYLGKESFEAKGFEQIITKKYLFFGFSAAALVWILTLTSNDLSVRILSFKKWKKVHRLVYLAFVLFTIHVLSIEKGNIPLLLILIAPVALLECSRFTQELRQKRIGLRRD